MQTEYPLEIRLSPSNRLRAMVLSFHLLLAASVLWASLPKEIVWSSLLVVLLSLLWSWFRRPELNGSAVVLQHDQRGWRLSGSARHFPDEPSAVELSGQWFVSPYLIAMTFSDMASQRTYPLVLLTDSVGPDLHRQLRLQLRWKE